MVQELYSGRSVQRKHPTKATKLEFLEFVAGCRGADVVTATQRFYLSDIGARGKFRRLVKQGLLETIPHTYGRTKAWQLTKAGWRYLAYLREAENYGGTKGLLASNLTHQVASYKAECEHWREVIEDSSGIYQQLVNVANENVDLRRARDQAWAENKRLRTQIDAYQRALLARPRSKL